MNHLIFSLTTLFVVFLWSCFFVGGDTYSSLGERLVRGMITIIKLMLWTAFALSVSLLISYIFNVMQGRNGLETLLFLREEFLALPLEKLSEDAGNIASWIGMALNGISLTIVLAFVGHWVYSDRKKPDDGVGT